MEHASAQNICVIGLGYIGLPTAALIASHQFPVIGVDNNAEVVATINQGKIHIVEPELDHLVAGVVAEKFFQAQTTIPVAKVYVIAVPTPLCKQTQKPDVSYIKNVATQLAPQLQAGALVILESTSPVGTTAQLTQWLADLRPDLSFPLQSASPDVSICYCPERVLPGRILVELKENDRLVGGMTDQCTELGLNFYRQFVEGNCMATSAELAELAKLTENASRDVAIAFANELSLVCDALGADVWELIKLANLHPRVNILKPGPGVGGHCIAVDPWFIIDSAPDVTPLMQAARKVNDHKPETVIQKIIAGAQRYAKPTIAFLGIAFKKDVDDLRNSPALYITESVAHQLTTSKVLVVEPNIKSLPASLNEQATLTSLSEACTQADIIVLLVEHKQFRIKPAEVTQDKLVIDVQGLW